MSQIEEIIYFITTRTDHDKLIYSSTKIKTVNDPSILDEYLTGKNHAGVDTETNGNRHWVSDLLLISLGDRNTQFVLDCTCGLLPEFARILNKHSERLLVFGHNFKFDLNILIPHGIYFPFVFDTMVASQRTYLGMGSVTHNLEDVFARELKVFMNTDKSISKEFLKMTLRSTFTVRQIVYSAKDIGRLEDIARVLKGKLAFYGQYEWFKAVENPLVNTLSEMELKGMTLYENKWELIITDKKIELGKTEIKLDKEADILCNTKTKVRRKGTTQILSLFGPPTEVDNKNIKHRNYSSSKQVLKLITKLGEPTPMFKEKKSPLKPSMREAAVQQYLIERPQSKLKTFLKDYINYKELEKFITSYGLKFMNSEIRKKNKLELGYKSPATGRVLTSFKQCQTDTGRLASGDAKSGYYNSQQIPAKPNVRQCFGLSAEEIAEGYFLTTCDLSGAELIIMAALADDQILYEIGADKIIDGKKVEGDLHSPIATKCWRAVYNFKKEMFLKQYGQEQFDNADPSKLDQYFTIFDSDNKTYTLSYDFEVTKKVNKQLRTDFKPMTFGVVYGLMANKGAQTLNIAKAEAQVAIDVIKKEIPKTIAMVEMAARFAFCDGYVIFNNRSNNRRWFEPVINAMSELTHITDRDRRASMVRGELPFMVVGGIEGEARNCRIQGTQADMIKESMVLTQRLLDKYPKEKVLLTRNEYIKTPGLRLSVHDELVGNHKQTGLGQEIAETMTNTANLYLAPYSSNIRMKADYQTLVTWTK